MRLPVVLYRSLLRYTRKELVQNTLFFLPTGALSPTLTPHWPVAVVRNADEMRQAVKEVFRNSASLTDKDEISTKIDLAFLLLRELEGFLPVLEGLRERRRDHSERAGIKFFVGQVVRHRTRGYRGVVFQWDRRPAVDGIGRFVDTKRGADQPFYHIIPDVQDCITLKVDPGVGYFRDVHYLPEDDLELVEEELERRVSNELLEQAFEGYSSLGGMFVPCSHLCYAYPADVHAAQEMTGTDVEEMRQHVKLVTEEGQVLSGWVEGLAGRLLAQLRDESVWKKPISSRNMAAAGVDEGNWDDALPPEEGLAKALLQMLTEAGNQNSYRAVAKFLEMYTRLEVILKRRRLVTEPDNENFSFSVGDIVKHKKFQYKAVVRGFDLRPRYDVSLWDGVRGLPRGAEQPFYDLLPDQDHCMEMFGSPRPRLYAAQENLERDVDAGPNVSSPLLRSSFSGFEPGLGRFLPLEGLRFSYPDSAYYQTGAGKKLGGEEERHAHMEAALRRILHRIRRDMWDALREGNMDSKIGRLLQQATSKADAEAMEQMGHTLSLSEIFSSENEGGSDALEQFWEDMDSGMSAFRRGRNADALKAYDGILRRFPGLEGVLYKRSVTHLVDGDPMECLEDTRAILSANPRSSAALATQGQALLNLNKVDEAMADLAAACSLNPWGLGACSLQQARELDRRTSKVKKSRKKGRKNHKEGGEGGGSRDDGTN
jgi:hemimethylated DNA binding protein